MTTDTFELKAALRRDLRARRAALSPDWVRATSAAAQERLMAVDAWRGARAICCYVAMPLETQTDRLLRGCWDTGRRVCVPVFRRPLKRYALAWLEADDPLTAGFWNVPEPAAPRWAEAAALDLVVVPGVGFDRRGGRLGHGKGYYDRLLTLPALAAARKIGLAFDWQMVATVPMTDHDIRMDAVVTERAVYDEI